MNWDRAAEEYLAVAHEVLCDLKPAVEALADLLAQRLRAGGKLLACGNGGSAADAQHLAAELVNRFLKDRRPYAAIALTTDTSILTSVGNDFGFEQAFSKQVEALGAPGDALIVFTTSGNSANILRAVEAARARGMLTVAVTGGTGGRVRDMVDRCLCVAASAHTPRIQEGHQFLLHALCERIEELLG